MGAKRSHAGLLRMALVAAASRANDTSTAGVRGVRDGIITAEYHRAEARVLAHFTHLGYAADDAAAANSSSLCQSANALVLPPHCTRSLKFELDGAARTVTWRAGDSAAARAAAAAAAVMDLPRDQRCTAVGCGAERLAAAVDAAEARVVVHKPEPLDYKDAAGLARALAADGYAVVRALDAVETEELAAGILALAGAAPGAADAACALRRSANPVTGTLSRGNAVANGGAHAWALWRARTRRGILSTFEALWNETDLLSSFDYPSALLSATQTEPVPICAKIKTFYAPLISW